LLQFNVNMFNSSSWCLFHSSDVNLKHAFQDYDLNQEQEGEDEDMRDESNEAQEHDKLNQRKYQPYKFSGRSYPFDFQREKPIIDKLRTWMDSYFMDNSWIFKKMVRRLGDIRSAANINADYEFDVLVKVLRVFEKDEYDLELRIKDQSNELWFISLPKLKFGYISEGDVIRVRSVNINITSKRNLLEVRPGTNILRFTQSNPIILEMKETVEGESEADKLMMDEANAETLMKPITFTEITDLDMQDLPLFKLDDLYRRYDELPAEVKQRNLFKVKFFVLRVDPKDLRECVKVMN